MREAQKRIKEISKAAQRAIFLTGQLLAFSHTQVLHSEIIDLNAEISNVEKMLHHIIGEDINLLIAQGSGSGLVMTDAGQADKIIMNLPRGGTLTIETANIELNSDSISGYEGAAPGGIIQVFSELKAGTAFKIYLPQVDKEIVSTDKDTGSEIESR
ncbi:MAG: hypothetical protein J7L76_07585 [Spirochaetaceae bacterium]|nr:hypothetical protein [Spirochaetaceae bacterium]